MNIKNKMKTIVLIGGLTSMALLFSRCSSLSSDTSGSASLTTAEKITSGLGTATETMQSMGSALASGNSSFSVGNQIMSPTTSCTENGEPGNDDDLNGVVNNSTEKYNSTSDIEYGLQKFYCTLAADSSGPETVTGAVRLIKVVSCAVERQLGGINFDGVPVAVTGITIDTNCATAETLEDMNGSPTTSITISTNATITASLNPTFSEIPGNTHYTHGIRIASDDGTTLKFIILAKFDDTIAGDPIENGDFEFATFGTGTVMQGTSEEYTAGKIDRVTTNSGTLWFESRINRIKADINDAACNPGQASSSCGFVRHTRLRTDITFASDGDIADVSNMTGIILDGYDITGSGMTADFTNIVTAQGSLGTNIYGKVWNTSSTPESFDGTNSQLASLDATPILSCITSGSAISADCSGATPLEPTGYAVTFVPQTVSGTWLQTLAAGGGLGYTESTDLTDAQTGP